MKVRGDRSISEISKSIHSKAMELGFAACGFSKAEELPEHAERLKDWLEKDMHGRMGYMANHFAKENRPQSSGGGFKKRNIPLI